MIFMATSTIFSGSSRYANDFSQVIERSVALAALPITQLASQRTALSDQSTALSDLAGLVSSFRTALGGAGSAVTAMKVSSSDGASVSASASETALAGSYSIQVLSTGSRSVSSSADTLPAVTDYAVQNISSATAFRLTVDGSTHTFSPSGNSLASLAEAINADSSYGVQAAIVNLGSASAPNYKLSLQSTRLGPIGMQLEALGETPEMLLDEISQGALATYRINGQPSGSPLTSAMATQVPVSPGLTIDLLKEGSSEVVVQRDTSKLTSALANFASMYNKLMSEVDKHRGQSNGPLGGHSVLSTIANSLRRLTGYTSNGTIKSIEQLGFSFSDSGVLSFDAAKFETLSPSSVTEFLGSKQGGGLIASAESILGMIDSEAGVIPSTLKSVRDQIAETDRQVVANQERLELLKQRLANQMAEADALIGMMEQQVSYMTGLFEAMRANARS
jgi:flagellar hook-associated protein 2